MNEHLQPVFEVLLPELNRGRIKYWVYGGLGIAAVVGEFYRRNKDVDIFVLGDHAYERARTILNILCEKKGFKLIDCKMLKGRRKFEVRSKPTDKYDILSVVPVYREGGLVKFVFKGRSEMYLDEILDRKSKKIGDYEFFTPPNKWIKELFKTYLSNRLDKKKRKKVQKDAQKILTLEERRELKIPELIVKGG